MNYASINITNVEHPITFSTTDTTADNQLLDAANLWSIVPGSDGFHLWGNKLMQASSSEQSDRFLTTRTVLDRFEMFMRRAQLPLLSRRLTPASISATLVSMEDEVVRLKNLGIIQPDDGVVEDAINNTIANLRGW